MTQFINKAGWHSLEQANHVQSWNIQTDIENKAYSLEEILVSLKVIPKHSSEMLVRRKT